MARRRRLTRTPLLVATAGVALSVGCSDGGKPPVVTGNLVAPPPISGTVCVDTEPEGATLTIQGEQTERCRDVEAMGGSVHIEVTASGYVPVDKHVQLSADGEKQELTIALTEVEQPPREPPVGNLVAPPELPAPPPSEGG